MNINKILVPYTVTIHGNIETDNTKLEEIKDDILSSNMNFLISKADSYFIEIDEEKVIEQINNKGVEEN